jgi:hypothetical protein
VKCTDCLQLSMALIKEFCLESMKVFFEVCEVNSYLQTLLNSAYTFYEECDGEE